MTAPRILWADTETFSPIDLKTHGTARYAEAAEVMIWTYALDDGPVQLWDATAEPEMPFDLAEYLADDSILINFQNSYFDRTVLAATGLPLPIHRFRDTMIKAMVHSLPGALEKIGEILQLAEDKQKDKRGRELIQLFCKPRPKNSKLRRATRLTHPKEWAEFCEYAIADTEAMRAADKALPGWNYKGDELALWHLDQTINSRGVAVDVDLAHAAIRAVERAQKLLAARTQELTNHEVRAATQRDALLRHLCIHYGVDLPDLQKSTLERRIDDASLPWALRELLAIRLQASTTSTSKYRRLINAVNSDGRLRGLLQFSGAIRTGRWAGRTFQPQNLPRPTLKANQIEEGIGAMKADCEDLVTDNVMELASSALRGCIVAPAGKRLVVSDLSNIEGRVLAWLAGEEWKLRAFSDFDAGTGHDIYALAYAKSFGVTPDSVMADKKAGGNQRQIGKVQELALGYEGGVGAFLTFAAAYGIDLEAMADQAASAIPRPIWQEAEGSLRWTKQKHRSTFGLSDNAWLTCESFKRSWRYAHPNVTSFWRDLGDVVRAAIARPGVTLECRMLKVRRDGNWLRIRLPSGRCLCYPGPRVDADGQISYMGVNQYSRKWTRIKTYGGKLAENVTQAVARDVMAANMPLIESAGFEIVLTVHDEVITEAPDTDAFDDARLSALLSTNPPWAPDLPLAAGGFTAYRYRKD